MTNGNSTVIPSITSYETEIRKGAGVQSAIAQRSIGGMTIRELFAAMAMQGIMATDCLSTDYSAERAVKAADALITELNKPIPQ